MNAARTAAAAAAAAIHEGIQPAGQARILVGIQ